MMQNKKSVQESASVRLRHLWRFASGFRWTYLFAVLCLGVATTARTGTFSLLGVFIDATVSRSEFASGIIGPVAGILLLAVVEGGFSFLSGRLAAKTSENVARRLRDRLYDHIQHLPFGYHDRTPTGELLQRCTSDVEAVRRFFADQAIGVGRIILLFLVNFAAVALLNLQLALLSVVVVPMIVLVSAFFFQRVSKIYESYQDQDAVLSTVLQENLTGVRVVRAFARQVFETAKFEKENWEKFRRGKRLLVMHSLFWPSTDILCAAQVLAGYMIGAIMAISGELTLGQYIAYVGQVVFLIWPMRDLGRLVVHASSGLVSASRVEEILRQDRESLDDTGFRPEGALRGEVEFRRTGFVYRGDAHVLREISFHCRPGETVAVLGPTGSGKTSLVNLLPRFYEYTAGQILLDGIELNRYSRAYLRRQIGIVEQEPFLFSRSIRENITYGVGREVPDAEVEAAARAAAIHDVVVHFPAGYRTVVGEKGVTLSGGQKQRVAIARTLLKNPRLLILDDSTSSVDTDTEAEIREALVQLMRGRTTFLIAHRIQSVLRADRILVLDHGRLAQMGTHAELVRQDGLYRRIYLLQSQIEQEVESELEHARSLSDENPAATPPG